MSEKQRADVALVERGLCESRTKAQVSIMAGEVYVGTRRIDKAYSWEYPLAAHGLMHSVIRNAWAGEPYEIDTLFMFMANVAWNSSMNSAGTAEMLQAKKADGTYRIPHIIYSDAFFSETVAYADLILPDTTYLERHDCISLLDRPICEADHAADAIRWPVVEPDREVRGFQSVLVDLAGRLGLPPFVTADGKPMEPAPVKLLLMEAGPSQSMVPSLPMELIALV